MTWIREHLDDLHVYGGTAMVAAGAALLHPAAGLIAAGAILLVTGLVVAWRKAPLPPRGND